jgi:hypothetical protein
LGKLSLCCRLPAFVVVPAISFIPAAATVPNVAAVPVVAGGPAVVVAPTVAVYFINMFLTIYLHKPKCWAPCLSTTLLFNRLLNDYQREHWCKAAEEHQSNLAENPKGHKICYRFQMDGNHFLKQIYTHH